MSITIDKDSLGEGILYCKDTNLIYWVDINNNTIKKLDLSKTNSIQESIKIQSKPSAILSIRNDHIIFLDDSGVSKLHLKNYFVEQVSVNKNLFKNINNRSNDGVLLRNKKIIYGVMDHNPKHNSGGLYIYNNDDHEQFDEMGIPNLFLEIDNMILIADSFEGIIYQYDLPSLGNKQIWLDLSSHSYTPDGGCVGPDGLIYIAMWGGGFVAQYSKKAELLNKFYVSAKNPTNCAFISNNQMYITSAFDNTTVDDLEKYPESGRLIKIEI